MATLSDITFPYFDIALTTKCKDEDLFTVVHKIKPTWKLSDVKIERVKNGFLNNTYTCLHKDDIETNDGLFIRVNGENCKNLERIFVDKELEIRYLKELTKHGIGNNFFLKIHTKDVYFLV